MSVMLQKFEGAKTKDNSEDGVRVGPQSSSTFISTIFVICRRLHGHRAQQTEKGILTGADTEDHSRMNLAMGPCVGGNRVNGLESSRGIRRMQVDLTIASFVLSLLFQVGR